MVGKLKVIFLTLLVMSMAAGAQADSVFPFAVGYTASYSAYNSTSPSNTWTATLSITGTATINSTTYLIMQMNNWNGGGVGDTNSMDVLLTSDTFSILNGGLQTYFKQLPAGQSWTLNNAQGVATTATIEAIGPLTVTAGTFNNVYEVHYVAGNQNTFMYWQPGVGLIEDVDSTLGSSSNGLTQELTSYATPLPPSLVLFGSGLAGLIGFRRLRRS